ncbi:MAG: hypothetical protein V3U87_16865 [Methylococcaceae bacterium]
MNSKKSFYKTPAIALLLSGVMITFGATAFLPAHADIKNITSTVRVQVRNNEEKRLAKSEENSYKKQMQTLENHYRNLAIKAEQNGENSAPLFAAADHFNAASKEQSK